MKSFNTTKKSRNFLNSQQAGALTALMIVTGQTTIRIQLLVDHLGLLYPPETRQVALVVSITSQQIFDLLLLSAGFACNNWSSTSEFFCVNLSGLVTIALGTLHAKLTDFDWMTGPKFALQAGQALSGNNMATETNAGLTCGIHLPELNDQSSEKNANASTMTRNQQSSKQEILSQKTDLLQQFNNLAESIKLSASSTMREDKSRRETEWRARAHQRQLKHRESFPILVEETEFRAAKAEQVHQSIEDEADRAQKRQETSILAIASTIQRMLSAANGGHQSGDIADIASLRADVQATTESVMETAITEIASLRTDLRNTNESLKNARREVDHIHRNALTDHILEGRLQQSIKGLVSWKAHEAVEAKLADLSVELSSRKSIHELVESIMSEMQLWSGLTEKHKVNLISLKDDVAKEQASRTAALQEMGDKLSSSISSIHTVLDTITSRVRKQDEEFSTFQGMVDEMNSKLENLQWNVKSLEVQAQQSTSLTGLDKMEQKFEDSNEQLLRTIREEQSVVREAFMQELGTLEQHAKDLVDVKANASAFRKALEDISKRCTVSQNQQSTDNPGNVLMQQVGPKIANLGDEIKIITAKSTALEHEIRAIGHFVKNQQQQFDGLTTTQVTQNMVNTMARMYPPHPAHIYAQINQLAASHKAVEGIVRLLSNKHEAINSSLPAGFVKELQPMREKITELSQSQAKLQHDCTVLSERITVEVSDLKAQTQSNFARVMNDISEARGLKTRSNVIAPTPSSMESGVTSVSAGAAQPRADETRASGSDSEIPLQARKRCTPIASSSGAPSNANGKRRRTSVSSCDDDVPLAATTIKRNKHIRRMNKSSGGNL